MNALTDGLPKKNYAFPVPMPSPSLSELAIGGVAADDPTAQMVWEALRGIRKAAEGAYKVALFVHQDDTLSEAGRHVKVSQTAHQVVKQALPLADRARENLETWITKIRMKTAAPEPDMTVRGVYLATEIRARLSAMTASERRKVLATADEATVSAVLSGPGYLSGLTPLEIEAARMGWATKKFPDELKRLQYLESIGDHLQRAGSLLLGYETKLFDRSLVQAARARAKVASDAIAAATFSA
jgi:hypothetical protein